MLTSLPQKSRALLQNYHRESQTQALLLREDLALGTTICVASSVPVLRKKRREQADLHYAAMGDLGPQRHQCLADMRR